MANVPEPSKNTLTTLLNLKQLHSDGQFWDVQLQVGNRLFKCQRSLLAANSEYFYTMFSSAFEESNATKDQPVILHQMDGTVFEKILDFTYTGEIRIKGSNVLQLLFMSDFLRLRTGYVKDQCRRYVENRSRKKKPMFNALDLLCFAWLTGENVLVDDLRAHISRHLYHYSKAARLMTISFEILNALLEFSKNFIAPLPGSADILLDIVHNWINCNREARSRYYSDLMKNINFANVSSKFSRILMNKLQNALNEAVNLHKDIRSPSELNILVSCIETKLTDGGPHFDGIISFNFKNVSDWPILNLTFYSSSVIISNLSWKIGAGLRNDDLVMHLFCDGTNLTPAWYCYASAIFTVVSHKEGRANFVRRINRKLYSSYSIPYNPPYAWGPQSYLKWKDLMNPANGFIKEDDSITLNVHVSADVPFLKMI